MKSSVILIFACLVLVGCGNSNNNTAASDNITQNSTPPAADTVSKIVPIQEVNKSVEVAPKTDSAANTPKSQLSNSENGKKVFSKCIACHGAKANLKALNNSQDISKWSSAEIAEALKGYKSGAYGSKMKASMFPIVKPLSEDDMADVSNYIQTLNR